MVGAFPILDWLSLLGLAGLVGAGGQGIRVIVGLKKLNDAAGAGVGVGDLLVASKLLVSLLIGAIAGGLAAAATMNPHAAITGQQIAGLAAAGYAGADFIEGFMSKAAPAPGAAVGKEAVGVGGATPAAPVAPNPAV